MKTKAETKTSSSSLSSLTEGLNPEQAKAVLAEKDTGIRVVAGAGTGKTHLISHRFAALVQTMTKKGIAHPAEKILAVTFTVKAAGQMHDRINRLLLKNGMDGLSPYTTITNFHGLCNQLLRRHALELGLTPDFSILGGLEKTLLMTRLFEGIKHGEYTDISHALKRSGLHEKIAPDILSLARLQVLPVEPIEAFLDELPGILDKIKSTGNSPQQFYETAHAQGKSFNETLKIIPVKTPTGQLLESNEAYAQLWSKHLSSRADDTWSFLGNEDQRLRYHEKRMLTRANPHKYDWKDHEPFYKSQLEWLAKFKYEGEMPFVWQDGRKKTFLCGSGDVSFLDDIQSAEQQFIETTAAVYALYQHTLHQQNRCDFDDLINRTLELFQTTPALKKHYQQFYEALIVDEFQDSNGSQLRLMQQLLHPDATPITVVGDLKQSIYGFRHAQPENMGLIFEDAETGSRRPYEAISLHTNYRSRSPILEVANTMARAITGDDSQRLDLPPETESDEKAAPVHWVTLGQSEEVEGRHGTVRKMKEPIHALKDREACFIAREAARLIASGEYQPKDIAVLVSKHHRADDIEAELRYLGIPAVKQKNRGFFEEPVIHDALALLRLLHNPHHEGALVRLLQKKLSQRQCRDLAQLRKQREQTLFQVLEQLADTSVYPTCPLPVRTALVNLTSEIHHARKMMARADLVHTFLHLADTLGLVDPELPHDDQVELRTHLNIFKKLLYQLVKDSQLTPSLSEVLGTLEQYQADHALELPRNTELTDENAVQLMTIHVAKGLEFPVVFAAYTEDATRGNRTFGGEPLLHFDPQYAGKDGFGLFLRKYGSETTLKSLVYKHTWEAPRHEAEEKRKFYVAVTRAEKKLYVIRCEKSARWTAAEHFPADALKTITEDDDPEQFYEAYLNPKEDDALHLSIKKALENTPEKAPEKSAKPPTINTQPCDAEAPSLATPLHLSFSKINTFRACPAQYWLKYVGSLPEPESDAEERGQCVHQLIEKHYRRNGEPDTSEIMALVDHHFPDQNSPQRDQTLTLYRMFCESPYAYPHLKKQGYRVESEKTFQFSLPVKSHTAIFSGAIDLVLHHDNQNTMSLIDFKTNKMLTPEKQLEYFQQLALYREGLKHICPDQPIADEHLKLVHLTPDGPTEYAATTTEQADLERHLSPIIEAVHLAHEANTLPDRPAHADCTRCPYKTLCPKAQR